MIILKDNSGYFSVPGLWLDNLQLFLSSVNKPVWISEHEPSLVFLWLVMVCVQLLLEKVWLFLIWGIFIPTVFWTSVPGMSLRLHLWACLVSRMYSAYQLGEDSEDDLYQEDEGDSEASEVNSELEFRLYSQLHYSSNAGEMAELVDTVQEVGGQGPQQPEVTSEAADGDEDNEETEEGPVLSPDTSDTNLKKKERKKSIKKKTKTKPEKQNLPFPFEEVIVIDSSPEVISVSDDNSSSEDTGVCSSKDGCSQPKPTSTPAQQVETCKKGWERFLGYMLSVTLAKTLLGDEASLRLIYCFA